MGFRCFLVIFLWGLLGQSASAHTDVTQSLNMNCPSGNCHQLERNLSTDSMKCAPAAQDTFSRAPLSEGAQIRGSLLYFSLVRAPYRYDVFPSDRGGLVIGLRVGVEGLSRVQLENLWAKVKMAEVIWNINAPYGMWFVFQLVDLTESHEESVHFKVRYTTRRSRGPYNEVWSAQWASVMVAHEIGHMLGLNDEYDFWGGTSRCEKSSLMCSVEHGAPEMYHYYLIARRVQCNDGEWAEPIADLSEYGLSVRAQGVDLTPKPKPPPLNCLRNPQGQEHCI